jgi:hypothetical protein
MWPSLVQGILGSSVTGVDDVAPDCEPAAVGAEG